MGGEAVAQSFTHIIVDEVHERDKLSDFLLTVLRDMLDRLGNHHHSVAVIAIHVAGSVADPDSGSGAFLTTGTRDGYIIRIRDTDPG
jgi:hypothetical protein